MKILLVTCLILISFELIASEDVKWKDVCINIRDSLSSSPDADMNAVADKVLWIGKSNVIRVSNKLLDFDALNIEFQKSQKSHDSLVKEINLDSSKLIVMVQREYR